MSFVTLVLASFTLALAASSTPPPDQVPNFHIRFEVHIINGFISSDKPLNIHCRSKDDDLGEHTLWKGQDFNWHFKAWFTTRFYCDFKWDSQQQHIDVFYIGGSTSLACLGTGKCFWLVRESGFYASEDYKNWVKKFDWHG